MQKWVTGTISSLLIGFFLQGCATPAVQTRGEAMGSSVQQTVYAKMDEFKACYDQGIRPPNPTSEGLVVLAFDIEPTGKPARVGVQESTLKRPDIEKCLVTRFRSLRFKPFAKGGSVQARYPFKFSHA